MKITVDYIVEGKIRTKVFDMTQQSVNKESITMAKHLLIDLLDQILFELT